jgi:hypothetical protein
MNTDCRRASIQPQCVIAPAAARRQRLGRLRDHPPSPPPPARNCERELENDLMRPPSKNCPENHCPQCSSCIAGRYLILASSSSKLSKQQTASSSSSSKQQASSEQQQSTTGGEPLGPASRY